MNLVPFAMDEFKDYFVIFKVDNGDDLNAYLWVYDDGNAKLTDIYGISSYCNHAVSPIYVGEIPEEQIEEATAKLEEISGDKKKELVDGFNQRMEQLASNEEMYDERKEYERGVLKDIEEGKNVKDGLFWFM